MAERLICTEIDNPEALSKYYKLLLSITRVITCAVLSRGPHNEQTIEQTRSFLASNRVLIVGIFKRQAKKGAGSPVDASGNIDELVELFIVLLTLTGFLEVSIMIATAYFYTS